jgi:hypothetical protein
MDWAEFLKAYQVADFTPLSESFLQRWGTEKWEPNHDDRQASAMLHTQIASRVTTQRLPYQDGIEQAALESVFELFQKTRDINDRFPECRHFDAVAWEVLNTWVRPFTAKWHRKGTQGALSALDSTDEFRADLARLQLTLRCFDRLLLHIRDGFPPPADTTSSRDDTRIENEMRGTLRWGISENYGGIDPAIAKEMNKLEQEAIRARRSHYGLKEVDHAVALALSGGGIRSATFALGVLVALAERGILPQIDYLSTVSGGGYFGSFLTAFLSSKSEAQIGLNAGDLPFRREAGEADALRYIRHHCRYLAAGSLWLRVKMMIAQLYGMVLNGFAITFLLVVGVGIERWLRSLSAVSTILAALNNSVIALLLVGSLSALLTMRVRGGWQRYADSFIAFPTVLLLVLALWAGLGISHTWIHTVLVKTIAWPSWTSIRWLSIVGAIPVIVSALSSLFGQLAKRSTFILIAISGFAVPVFFIGLYLFLYDIGGLAAIMIPYYGSLSVIYLYFAILILGSLVYFFLLDINFTSPHRHYRDRLADAFLIQPVDSQESEDPFQRAGMVRLSELTTAAPRSPYHLINCALNVPGSKNIRMQGRLTDFFLFSQSFCGSPLTGYRSTQSWEQADAHLDLGTAMAISGAAAAPQMGLGTKKSLSFWLALLNIRLGYWARIPSQTWMGFRGAPGLTCLLKEMTGSMDERGRWLNLTDGGHIENLAVYELLRRRCKYIIAVDGEEDSKMTFQGLTTLQRLAAIDLGVNIEIDLDDLRLNESGLSRSHFRFCRVRYPREGRSSEEQVGYLLYVKLSLTGNEGEFLRRYRTDDPAFPHDPTLNQFFTETQFEAYRSLGEHIGDKLFLRSIVGNLADSKFIEIDDWFMELGKSLLEPLPSPNQ